MTELSELNFDNELQIGKKNLDDLKTCLRIIKSYRIYFTSMMPHFSCPLRRWEAFVKYSIFKYTLFLASHPRVYLSELHEFNELIGQDLESFIWLVEKLKRADFHPPVLSHALSICYQLYLASMAQIFIAVYLLKSEICKPASYIRNVSEFLISLPTRTQIIHDRALSHAQTTYNI